LHNYLTSTYGFSFKISKEQYFSTYSLSPLTNPVKKEKKNPRNYNVAPAPRVILMVVPKVLGVNTFFDNYMLSQ